MISMKNNLKTQVRMLVVFTQKQLFQRLTFSLTCSLTCPPSTAFVLSPLATLPFVHHFFHPYILRFPPRSFAIYLTLHTLSYLSNFSCLHVFDSVPHLPFFSFYLFALLPSITLPSPPPPPALIHLSAYFPTTLYNYS